VGHRQAPVQDPGAQENRLSLQNEILDSILKGTARQPNTSVGHQCTYTPGGKEPVYIRIATRDSLFHTFAKISVFKIG
jgi:hypothetical protein